MSTPLSSVSACQLRVAALVAQVADALTVRGWRLATAESCTGGLIAACCTEQPGSSQWFDGAVVTYSNEAKQGWLGVPAAWIAQHGAVSEAVVCAMAEGVLARSDGRVHVAVAVSGIAGPGGATPGKPVGTVCLAWAVRGLPATATRLQLDGDRAQVHWQACEAALAGVLQAAQNRTA